MTHQEQATTTVFPSIALEKVLSLRVIAFLIDYALITLLTLIAYVCITFLGFLTFGLSWLLFPIILPIVALAYAGFTLGGKNQATPGMNITGLQIKTLDGQWVSPLLAILHSLIYWLTMTFPLILVVGLFTAKKQLLHDLILKTFMVRKGF